MRISKKLSVSMPSRAYTSFLLINERDTTKIYPMCQCPHGLIPHFYWHTRSRAVPTSGVCQCPHGLIPHFYEQLRSVVDWQKEVCQCPHRLIPHFYMNNNGTPDNIWDDTCQCPHRVIPHFYMRKLDYLRKLVNSVNALTGLYLISTNNFEAWWIGKRKCVNALTGLYLIST